MNYLTAALRRPRRRPSPAPACSRLSILWAALRDGRPLGQAAMVEAIYPSAVMFVGPGLIGSLAAVRC